MSPPARDARPRTERRSRRTDLRRRRRARRSRTQAAGTERHTRPTHPPFVAAVPTGTAFSVFPTPNSARAGHTQMGFTVADLRAAVADLMQRGVVFEEYDTPELRTIDGIVDLDGHSSAWFTDSEGNVIELIEVQ